MAALKKEVTSYTYRDYQTWPEDVRVELINGVVYNMAAPAQKHQWLVIELAGLFNHYLKGKGCRLFIAPADVRLNQDQGDDTVVQPDLFVVCDPSKLDGQNCNGAPDLIVEILSPSTASKDCVLKFNKYLEAGVREYWIINPEQQHIHVHTLVNGNYITTPYAQLEDDDRPQVTVGIFSDLVIDLVELFAVMAF